MLTFDAQGKWPRLIMYNGDSLHYPLFDHAYSLLPAFARKSIARIQAVVNLHDNGVDLTGSTACHHHPNFPTNCHAFLTSYLICQAIVMSL